MKKSKEAKQVNRIIKRLNRSLQKDVFGNRFYVRQTQKARLDGIDYFRFEMVDNEEPTRNTYINEWCTVYDVSRKVFGAVNDFIVRSNFWAKWFNDPGRYNEDKDFYKNN